jgi:hypothetical protein
MTNKSAGERGEGNLNYYETAGATKRYYVMANIGGNVPFHESSTLGPEKASRVA